MNRSKKSTPLMQQHSEIKQQHPDAILLFRVGDFYETFGQDAIITSQILNIALTKRNSHIEDSEYLAGFPHHALETYLHKLIQAGHRVAICDQMENPKHATGIVKRAVTEIVTPGTTLDSKSLASGSNNFLCAIVLKDNAYGIAFADFSTGDFFVSEGNQEYIDKLFQSFNPSEILVERTIQHHFKAMFGDHMLLYPLEKWIVDHQYTYDLLTQHFEVHSLKGFGIDQMALASMASGLIIHYLRVTKHSNLHHFKIIQRLDKSDYLWMDKFTIRNLELLQSNYEKGKSLIHVMDKTVSPMGSRRLKRWLMLPLKDSIKINERLDSVAFFVNDAAYLDKLIQQLKIFGDIERYVAKIPLKRIHPREILHLMKGLGVIQEMKTDFALCSNPYLQTLMHRLDECADLRKTIMHQLVDAPPLQIQKGDLLEKV